MCVSVPVPLSHPFFRCFHQLCLAIAVFSFRILVPTCSRAISFIYSFISVSICSVACILLFAWLPVCVCVCVSNSFHYFPLVSFRHTNMVFFLFACVPDHCIQNAIWVDRNEDDNSNSNSNNSSDWINMFEQLLACFFVDATVQYIVGTNFCVCVCLSMSMCVCVRKNNEATYEKGDTHIVRLESVLFKWMYFSIWK